jgi:aminoglycoside phosphotransferase (APT) family kinase protein
VAMHADELAIDGDLVRRLVSEQFPELGGLSVAAVRSTGTVNAIYRLGDELCVRLPRREAWAADLDQELHWLPELAPRLSLQVPEPVAGGRPGGGYPCTWAVYRWLQGRPFADDLVADEAEAAVSLAQFVTELRDIQPVVDAPRGGRPPLRELAADTRVAIEAARGVIDSDAAAESWERALEAPGWDGSGPVWVHADLLRPNVLVEGGRLRAVLDFGAAGVGDPAADVIAAWSIFGERGREIYRQALDVDVATWERARGFALHQAAMIVPYYRDSHPAFVAQAKRTVEQVLGS